ncbi:S-formylglutathione hydrolase [Pelagibaculum spongiae]|uniref:S-formylglutathione hydrolase n=1 Tax=Pelagibaculum spongiae TaxID=2080658 RepID=A0A2V1H0Q6_9GAMM|nr:S-formylglutathione hydrolase [Pelagibaculum spongiae]PVZ72229.1 S-formylglutathione hydrolase [Pelagibaculum spongiae]
MTDKLQLISCNKVHSGELRRYKHQASSVNCEMTFAVFLPLQALNSQGESLPALYWLSGLTCTDENFSQKSGAFKAASELGIVLIMPDTSPRGCNLPGEDDSYDFGSGAGFYLNATQAPWSEHYRMHDYVVNDLPELAEPLFNFSGERSISGHSMGGHGALICALRNPQRYNSISAFSPICNPSECPWGNKAFSNYLGNDRQQWKEWDASELLGKATDQLPLLIDQGSADEFLQLQLKPQALISAASKADYPLELRMQSGYDHSYFFIASFIEDHLHFHAKYLK